MCLCLLSYTSLCPSLCRSLTPPALRQFWLPLGHLGEQSFKTSQNLIFCNQIFGEHFPLFLFYNYFYGIGSLMVSHMCNMLSCYTFPPTLTNFPPTPVNTSSSLLVPFLASWLRALLYSLLSLIWGICVTFALGLFTVAWLGHEWHTVEDTDSAFPQIYPKEQFRSERQSPSVSFPHFPGCWWAQSCADPPQLSRVLSLCLQWQWHFTVLLPILQLLQSFQPSFAMILEPRRRCLSVLTSDEH